MGCSMALSSYVVLAFPAVMDLPLNTPGAALTAACEPTRESGAQMPQQGPEALLVHYSFSRMTIPSLRRSNSEAEQRVLAATCGGRTTVADVDVAVASRARPS